MKRCHLSEYVEDVAHSRQRAAAVRRAITEIYSEIKPDEIGWLIRFGAACASPEILARHGITVEELQEHIDRNDLGS